MSDVVITEDITLCIFATRHPDGTTTMRYHGAIPDKVRALLEACAGPVIAGVCKGCDAGSYAEDDPWWPCRTVDLLAERLLGVQ